MKRLNFIFALSLFSISLFAQNFPDNIDVFTDSAVLRVDIIIQNDSLTALFDNPYIDHEYPATFIFTNQTQKDTLLNVGFRIRGNTSRDSQKKSFKISFNTFVTARKYSGLDKMNLNGEHNDPSIIRSKLCWDLYRKVGVPAPRANHVELYINNIYYGLYLNVENIDDRFVKSRFGNEEGNLYKCLSPASLQYIDGNPDSYKFRANNRRAYELKTNEKEDNYSDLLHFIDVLNNTPESSFTTEIEKVFNVESYLKTLSMDILTGNWDSYHYNRNNYYLYHNTFSNKFEFIPYDVDNTFGIDWVGVDWGTRDIYNWGSESCPLYNRIMNVKQYKDLFSNYVMSHLTKYFNTNVLFPVIDSRKNIIKASAERDTYRTLDWGWTYDDFLESYNNPVTSFHVFYGLKPYIQTRYDNAFAQIESPTHSISVNTTSIGLYPNPFSESTSIQLYSSITNISYVCIYNMSGTLVFSTSINEIPVIWNGTDMAGNKLSNGVYFITAGYKDNPHVYQSKVILMR